MGRKRDRDAGGDAGGGDEPSRAGGGGEEGERAAQRPRRAEPSIGERTSHIKNKQRRGEVYEKLRHKAKARKGAIAG